MTKAIQIQNDEKYLINMHVVCFVLRLTAYRNDLHATQDRILSLISQWHPFFPASPMKIVAQSNFSCCALNQMAIRWISFLIYSTFMSTICVKSV